MEECICKYCSKLFSNKYILRRHIKNASYCIETRKSKDTFECEYCLDSFILSSKLSKHLSNCQEKINFEHQSQQEKENHERQIQMGKKNLERKKEINNLKKIIKEKNAKMEDLEEKLLEKERKIKELEEYSNSLKCEIAEKKGYIACSNKPVVTNNKNIIKNITTIKLAAIPTANIKPLTINLVKENLDKYTYESFLAGKKGILRFIKNLVCLENKDGEKELNYACTDSSRNKYHRLMESREWKLDEGGYFINKILDELTPTAVKFSNQYQRDRTCTRALDADVFVGTIGMGEDRDKLVKDLKLLVNSIISV
jgi:hypothetical protein